MTDMFTNAQRAKVLTQALPYIKSIDKNRHGCYHKLKFGKHEQPRYQRRKEADTMEFDYSKLLGRIRECGYTQETLAKEIGITESSMSLKLTNKTPFKQIEIRLICKVLKIQSNEIGVYFFTPKVRKTRTV